MRKYKRMYKPPKSTAFRDRQPLYKEGKQTPEKYYIPFDYEDCFTQYLPPQEGYIFCPHFGETDILDIQCHRCHDLFFYQWAMCEDETWVRDMMRGGRTEAEAKYGTACTREEATLHVSRYKGMLFQENYQGNWEKAYDAYSGYDADTEDNQKRQKVNSESELQSEPKQPPVLLGSRQKSRPRPKKIQTKPLDGEDSNG